MILFLVLWCTSYYWYCTVVIQSKVRFVLILKNYVTLLGGWRIFLTTRLILGEFHDNFPGFSGFIFCRKLVHTKTILILFLVLWCTSYYWYCTVVIQSKVRFVLILKNYVTLLGGWRIFLTTRLILGEFHDNFPGFSGFRFCRKLVHTKTWQGA